MLCLPRNVGRSTAARSVDAAFPSPPVNIDDPTPIEKQPCAVHTTVRPLFEYPQGFDAMARTQKIMTAQSERHLLNHLLSECSPYRQASASRDSRSDDACLCQPSFNGTIRTSSLATSSRASCSMFSCTD